MGYSGDTEIFVGRLWDTWFEGRPRDEIHLLALAMASNLSENVSTRFVHYGFGDLLISSKLIR